MKKAIRIVASEGLRRAIRIISLTKKGVTIPGLAAEMKVPTSSVDNYVRRLEALGAIKRAPDPVHRPTSGRPPSLYHWAGRHMDIVELADAPVIRRARKAKKAKAKAAKKTRQARERKKAGRGKKAKGVARGATKRSTRAQRAHMKAARAEARKAAKKASRPPRRAPRKPAVRRAKAPAAPVTPAQPAAPVAA